MISEELRVEIAENCGIGQSHTPLAYHWPDIRYLFRKAWADDVYCDGEQHSSQDSSSSSSDDSESSERRDDSGDADNGIVCLFNGDNGEKFECLKEEIEDACNSAPCCGSRDGILQKVNREHEGTTDGKLKMID